MSDEIYRAHAHKKPGGHQGARRDRAWYLTPAGEAFLDQAQPSAPAEAKREEALSAS